MLPSRLFALALLLVGLLTQAAQAESIWARAEPRWRWLFADLRARAVGDIVTILVTESSSATTQAATSNSKDSSAEADEGSGLLRFLPLFGFRYGDNYEAKGKTSRSNVFTARVTATVIEVLPSGNLRIEGRRSLSVNAEDQVLVLRGTIRPEDVSPANTILSSEIADAEIKIEGFGPAARKQKPGILTRLFDWLF